MNLGTDININKILTVYYIDIHITTLIHAKILINILILYIVTYQFQSKVCDALSEHYQIRKQSYWPRNIESGGWGNPEEITIIGKKNHLSSVERTFELSNSNGY